MRALCWSARARRALNAALAAIAREDVARATALHAHIDEATARLRANPAAGREGRIAGTRELDIPHTLFTATYIVERGEIRIITLHRAGYAAPEQA